ncbi:unnamed protein product [Lactuca virosa]|uniref:Myb-like domain-containing protein n=1 Tax=Lactuca virosa TaxID=75947 RepID=A0AAU9LUE0_9ASTR|nr:unnamed protein product [Lactuca virosa]
MKTTSLRRGTKQQLHRSNVKSHGINQITKTPPWLSTKHMGLFSCLQDMVGTHLVLLVAAVVVVEVAAVVYMNLTFYWSFSWMSTIWTPVENKLFENALAKFDNYTPDWWQRMAEMVPGKTTTDVMRHYKELEDDVSSIEAGFYPKYGHNSSTSPFTLEWGNSNGVDGFLSPPTYGARGKRSSAAAVAVVAAGRPLEQERKKGVP